VKGGWLRRWFIRFYGGAKTARPDDLAPTLARIASGRLLAFHNDGAIFMNRENLLPSRSPGYYREFVAPSSGISGPGPRRIIVGQDGEIYFTGNHYKTFSRLN